ncbi:hypothetical protein [Spiroplasma chinense]|nr:hypothetical protein [Spiroplasma chinense]
MGVREYFEDKIELDEIQIYFKKNEMEIYVDDWKTAQEVLSSIYFSPFKVQNKNLTNGDFTVEKHTRKKIVLKPIIKNRKIKKLIFIKVSKINLVLKKFYKLKCNVITNSLFFKYSLLSRKEIIDRVFEKSSGLYMCYEFKDNNLKEAFKLHLLKNYNTFKNFHKNYFKVFESSLLFENRSIEKKINSKKSVNILLPGYFPNKKNITTLIQFLESNSIKYKIFEFSMTDYLKEIYKDNYDIKYKIFKPITNDYYTFCKIFISMVRGMTNRKKLINFLNRQYYLQENNRESVLKYINSNTNILVYGNLRHIYLTNSSINTFFYIDENDFYRFKDNWWQ